MKRPRHEVLAELFTPAELGALRDLLARDASPELDQVHVDVAVADEVARAVSPLTLGEFRQITDLARDDSPMALMIAGLGAAIGSAHVEPDGTVVVVAVPDPKDDAERFGNRG